MFRVGSAFCMQEIKRADHKWKDFRSIFLTLSILLELVLYRKGYHRWNYTWVKGFPSVDLPTQNGTILLCENTCLLELFEMLSQLLSPVIWHGQEVSERACDLPEVCGAVQASDSGQGPACGLHSLGDHWTLGLLVVGISLVPFPWMHGKGWCLLPQLERSLSLHFVLWFWISKAGKKS